jgi:hypothetical protein
MLNIKYQKLDSVVNRFILISQKKFKSYLIILSCCLLLALSSRLVAGYYLIGKNIAGTDKWIEVAAQHKKEEALSITGRKILIVSGSNSLFGLSAETIFKETKIPTVNLAIHAGLGVKYILDDAKTVIKEGDIVLLPLEYSFYLFNNQTDMVYLKYVLSNDTQYFSRLNPIQKFNLVVKLPTTDILQSILFPQNKQEVLAKLRESSVKGYCYTGFSLNKFGDELCNIRVKALNRIPIHLELPKSYKIDHYGIIRDFISWCQQKQVKVFPLYPVFHKNNEFYQEEYKMFFNEIKKYYKKIGVPILGNPYEAALPHNLMFNGRYHPNDNGRKLRTEQVIHLIRSAER